VCRLTKAAHIVGVETFQRPDARKAEAAALAFALVRLDCDGYELWREGVRISVVRDKLAKAADLLHIAPDAF
jgi:hypothetical protein